jgi:pyruvate formate lyase activating enzyme
MDGLIFDIKKYSINDGPGIRTTVFLKGCPLHCWWCHNPESQEFQQEHIDTSHKLDDKLYNQQKIVGNYMKPDKVLDEIMKDAVFYEESGGGVTFSGGEPCSQAEFLIMLARKCGEKKIHRALDTSGYTTVSIFSQLLSSIELFLYDIKLINDDLHQKYTGLSNHTIIENLKFLSAKKANIIIRIPVIPGITATKSNIEEIANLLYDLPNKVQEVHLLPYHKIAFNKYNRLAKPNPLYDMNNMKKEDVFPIKEFFEAKDFVVKIGG